MNPRRFLPLLLVTLLLAASIQPPAAAQAPELRIPSEHRRVQAEWIQEARQDLDRYAEDHDLSEGTVQRLHAGLNSTEESYQDDRWEAVVRQLVSLRVAAVYANLAQRAQDEEQPQEMYIETLDPRFSNISSDSPEVRGLINGTGDTVETVRGLEALYLSSQLLVQGNQQLQQYPRFRSLAQASGNETSESIYRTMVGTVVGAEWNFRYARDLVQLSRQADNRSRSPAVDPGKMKLAWDEMHEVVNATPMEGQAAAQAQESLNFTTSQKDWLVSTALGERYVLASIRSQLGRQAQQDRLDRDQLRQDLASKATNLSLVDDMEAAGFGAVNIKDAHKTAFGVLEEGEEGNASLQEAIDAFAGLDAKGAASRALLTLAEASTASDDEGEAPGGIGSLGVGLVGAGLGALLGAGAVYVALQGRRP